MNYNIYYSGKDEGAINVLRALSLNSRNVLSLLIFSQTKDGDKGTSAYYHNAETVAAVAEQLAPHLSKYQCGVLITHAPNDLYDLTATVFSFCYPVDYMTALSRLIPNVFCGWVAGYLPKGCSEVSDFHKISDAQYIEWLSTGTVAREFVQGAISDGYRLRVERDAQAIERFNEANAAGQAAYRANGSDE